MKRADKLLKRLSQLSHDCVNLELTELCSEQLEEVRGGSSLESFHEKWHQLSFKQQVFTVMGTLGMLTLIGLACYHHKAIGKGLSAITNRIKTDWNQHVGPKPEWKEIKVTVDDQPYLCYTRASEPNVTYYVPEAGLAGGKIYKKTGDVQTTLTQEGNAFDQADSNYVTMKHLGLL